MARKNKATMTAKETSQLIGILKIENETNSKEEREFNLEWIRLLIKACDNALTKERRGKK